jgi:hypothetical protein
MDIAYIQMGADMKFRNKEKFWYDIPANFEHCLQLLHTIS